MVATFVHCKSESGDDYYFGYPEDLSDSEAQIRVGRELGNESDYMWYMHIERV